MRIPNCKLFHHTFINNSFWAILGSFFSKGISFASIAWIARIIGPETLGEYNVIQTTVGMFGTIAGLGLGLAATKLIAEWRDKDIEKAARIIGSLFLLSFLISLAVTFIFISTSSWVSTSLLHNTKLTFLLQITSIIVILDSLNGVQNGVLSGFAAFKEITIVSIIVGIISAPLLIVGTYFYGLSGLIIMLLITRLINVIVNQIYLQKIFTIHKIEVKLQINYDVLKNIFGISIPSLLSSLSTSPVSWVTTTLFVNQPMGYKSLGLYNAANQLRTLVLLLPDSAGKVTIPQLANDYGCGNFKKFKSTVILTFVWNLVLSVLPAMALYFFASFFQQIIGTKFALSNNLILIILFTGILIAITNAIGYIFICSNLMWYDFVLRIFWGVALIILIILYGRYNGAIGYATSILGASVVHIIAQGIVILLKFRYNKK